MRGVDSPLGHMVAPQTRIPASHLLALTVQKKKKIKVAEPLQEEEEEEEEEEEVGGLFFERLSWRSDAPCAGCGGSRHGDSAMSGAERTTSLQSCC